MQIEKSETVSVQSTEDVVKARQAVRTQAQAIGLSILDETKFVTAASEIARNTVDYGGGGELTIEVIIGSTGRRGLRLVFEDEGPGIADVEQALHNGFSSAGGLGLGLGGAKRLSNEFSIESRTGGGTRVTLVRWT